MQYNENQSVKENIKISFLLQKFGFSLIDSTPKEFLYMEADFLQINVKKYSDDYDIKLSIGDFQVSFITSISFSKINYILFK